MASTQRHGTSVDRAHSRNEDFDGDRPTTPRPSMRSPDHAENPYILETPPPSLPGSLYTSPISAAKRLLASPSVPASPNDIQADELLKIVTKKPVGPYSVHDQAIEFTRRVELLDDSPVSKSFASVRRSDSIGRGVSPLVSAAGLDVSMSSAGSFTRTDVLVKFAEKVAGLQRKLENQARLHAELTSGAGWGIRKAKPSAELYSAVKREVCSDAMREVARLQNNLDHMVKVYGDLSNKNNSAEQVQEAKLIKLQRNYEKQMREIRDREQVLQKDNRDLGRRHNEAMANMSAMKKLAADKQNIEQRYSVTRTRYNEAETKIKASQNDLRARYQELQAARVELNDQKETIQKLQKLQADHEQQCAEYNLKLDRQNAELQDMARENAASRMDNMHFEEEIYKVRDEMRELREQNMRLEAFADNKVILDEDYVSSERRGLKEIWDEWKPNRAKITLSSLLCMSEPRKYEVDWPGKPRRKLKHYGIRKGDVDTTDVVTMTVNHHEIPLQFPREAITKLAVAKGGKGCYDVTFDAISLEGEPLEITGIHIKAPVSPRKPKISKTLLEYQEEAWQAIGAAWPREPRKPSSPYRTKTMGLSS